MKKKNGNIMNEACDMLVQNYNAGGKEFFVERIDYMLHLQGKKRTNLCECLQISSTIITAWKTRKTIPAADTTIAIADYLNVSVEWLVYGTLDKSIDAVHLLLQKYFGHIMLLEKLNTADRNMIVALTARLGAQHK